jgi:hypothetical protein
MFSEKQQSTKNDYSFSVVKDPEQKDGDVSPYFPANIAGLEGFTFIGDGYPLLEMGGNAPCYSKIPNPQTQRGIARTKSRIRDTKEDSVVVDGFANYDGAHYNALFPRPSIRDGRMRDIRDMVIVDNSLYLIGSVTIVTLLVGGLVIASFNKTA